MALVCSEAKIVNSKGLHARASAKLTRMVSEFKSVVTIRRGDVSASGNSIMDLLQLVAHQGSEVTIEANGEDAEQVVKAIQELIADGFGEIEV